MSHLYFLRGKLLQHILLPIDWMRVCWFIPIIFFRLVLWRKVFPLPFTTLQDIDEFKKLLKYFNDGLGPAVCIYTIVNLSWAATGIVWLFQYYVDDANDIYPITYVNVMNVVLWILISVAPFIQVRYTTSLYIHAVTLIILLSRINSLTHVTFFKAARLTNACSMIRAVGHEIRIRPFVYQTTPGEDLDSILLYTSSLKMSAKLFRIPIKGKYLCVLLTIGSISVLTLGQCQFFL